MSKIPTILSTKADRQLVGESQRLQNGVGQKQIRALPGLAS